MSDLASKFDYASLDTEARVVVKQKTTEIRDRMKRAASDIVVIGERLIAVKEVLVFGDFTRWLKSEFDWAHSTALRMMRVAETFKNANLANLNVAPSALYLLSDPSTPPEVRDEVIAAAKAGETVTHKDVKQRVEATRSKSIDEQCADENDYLDSLGMGGGEAAAPKRINMKREGEDDDVPNAVALERQVKHVETHDEPDAMTALIRNATRTMDRLKRLVELPELNKVDVCAAYQEARAAVVRVFAEIA